MKRIGFTGTSAGVTDPQSKMLIEWMRRWSDPVEFHHGDCIGADEQAHALAKAYGWRIVIHPGPNNAMRAFCTGYDVLYPVKPNLSRDVDIVDETELLVACPKGSEEVRSGTWFTVRQARKLSKPTIIIAPDGTALFSTNKLLRDLV